LIAGGVLLAAALVLAPRTRRSGLPRTLFVLLVLALDGLALRAVYGAQGPKDAGEAILVAGVMVLGLGGFLLWWTDIDRSVPRATLARAQDPRPH
jgi:drug/metabolite transporter (DMT)-like permease